MKKFVIFIIFVVLVVISVNDSSDYSILAKNEQSILLSDEYQNYFEKQQEKTIIDGLDELVILPKEEPVVEEKKLMIVAHPDDETIWGGSHLLQDKYTVVCITCGTVDYRVDEFKRVMEITEDDYLMLGFPDLTNYHIDDWSTVYNDIYNTLQNIIVSQNWSLIVTHNPEGEYRHIHHQMTSEMVTNIADKNKLYYFGKYYSADQIDIMNVPAIEESLYNRKMNELASIYVSQPLAMARHHHMMIHEDWIQYYNWN